MDPGCLYFVAVTDDIDQGYTWETEYERTWYVYV